MSMTKKEGFAALLQQQLQQFDRVVVQQATLRGMYMLQHEYWPFFYILYCY